MYELVSAPVVYAIKIYDTDAGQSSATRTRYTTSLLLTDLGLKHGRLHFAQGKLDCEINLLVIAECKRLGFTKVFLEVPAGTKATRYAKYVETADGLDRYMIEL